MNKLPLDQLLHGDCIELMRQMPDESIDLIFADPPYNLQLKGSLWRPDMTRVDAVKDTWDHFTSFEDYDRFTRTWLKECQRLLKPRSSIWVCGTYHNIFRVGAVMQDLGFWILNTVAWYKRDGTPNFNGTRLKNDVEFLIWAKRDENAQYTFHYRQMKTLNDDKQMGSVWDIPKVKRYEQLRDEHGHRIHSTQKPEELLMRVIAASSNPDDVVLDPFFGSGTTGAMAKHLRRRWIGIERNEDYIADARTRIHDIKPLAADDDLVVGINDLEKRQVAFRTLLRHGYLQVGQVLYLANTDKSAVILENGRLQSTDHEGTIHILCRHLKNVPSCNGWQVWLYEDEHGVRRPIDHLRRRFRSHRESDSA